MSGLKWRIVGAALITLAACGSGTITAGTSGLLSTAPPTSEELAQRQTIIEQWTSTTTETPKAPTLSTTTTTTLSTTTTAALPVLDQLVAYHFAPADRAWALRVVVCESSNNPDAVNTSSGASGWFQHLPKFWAERSTAAGIPGADIMGRDANVSVAAWLLYNTPQGKGHWAESENCWGQS